MKNVFLIDDDPFYTKILTKQIQDWGYNVTPYYCVEDAIPNLKLNPDLIILDHHFDNLNTKGTEYITFLKQHTKGSAILYASSETATEVIKSSLQKGADMYITKNENMYLDLKQIIKRLINKKNHHTFLKNQGC